MFYTMITLFITFYIMNNNIVNSVYNFWFALLDYKQHYKQQKTKIMIKMSAQTIFGTF